MSTMNDLIRGRLARATDRPRDAGDVKEVITSTDTLGRKQPRPNHGRADGGADTPAPGATDMNTFIRGT